VCPGGPVRRAEGTPGRRSVLVLGRELIALLGRDGVAEVDLIPHILVVSRFPHQISGVPSLMASLSELNSPNPTAILLPTHSNPFVQD